ncbi:MAG: SH3 domain-containing protein [Chloracidobacterium sp.]|nr:SH3 domain-containing protein [Chloracidobacterium sp.]
MKQCSVCKTTYTDDSLSFCLSDGSPLTAAEAEQETVVRKVGHGGLKVDLPPDQVTWVSPEKRAQPAKASNTWVKVLAIIAVVVILGVAGIGIVGALIYFQPGMNGSGTPSPSPMQSPTGTPATDPEKDRLREEIANIQRQLDEQKRNAGPGDAEPEDDPDIPDVARVNSPNDGFLALRSLPDSDRGIRLAKIPHGTELEIIDCEPYRKSIGGRSGRWCLVEYAGITGWVFDAWLAK